MNAWISGWGYRETDFSLFPIFAENETQRVWFYNNLHSDTLRLRFSNRYGREVLPVHQVTAAKCDENGALLPGSSVEVTFGGETGLCLGQKEVRSSDPVNLQVQPGDWISVSIYIKEKVRITGAISSQSRLVTRMSCQKGGNFCLSETVRGERFLDEARGFIALKPLYHNVAVGLTDAEFYCEDAENIRTVTVFGDSITQHGNWSEAVTRRLYAAAPGRAAVVNRGICGNRVLHDASIRSLFGGYFGEGALERFEEDVFRTPGNRVDCVIFQEGVNDIIQPYDGTCPQYEKVSASQILEGYRKITAIAHSHSAKVLGSTVMPFRGFNAVWNLDSENTRQQVNAAVRQQGIFDTVLDFASVVCDAEDETHLALRYNCGDNIHPNIAGGAAIADSVDLACILML